MILNSFINIIVIVASMIVLNKWAWEKVEKIEDSIEKSVEIIIIVIANIFLIIYYIDRFNLPTTFKLSTNVNTQNWLMIITTCVSSVISASIGGLIAFGIARKQVEGNNIQNNENLRVQNMPMLKYELKIEDVENEKIDIEHLIISNCEKTTSRQYKLIIFIKNIGLNNVKRIFVDFESDFTNNKDRILGKNSVIPIEKDETQQLYRYFALENEKEYRMKLEVYYEDVLQNWYYQVVDIKYSTLSKNLDVNENVNYNINEEILLEEKNVPKEL